MGVAYGGVDSYDFHSLECIQCLAERRKGGETGVSWVEALRGQEVWDTMELGSWDDGGWSLKLLESCLTRSHTLQQARKDEKKEGNLGGSFCKRFPSFQEMREIVDDPIAYRFQYTDGTRGTMLLLNKLVADFNVAAKLVGRDDLLSCQMYLDAGRAPDVPNNVQYSSLTMSNAEKLFLSNESQYPIERTLMTGGIVEAGCQSLTLKKKILTPHMAGLTYTAPEQSLFGGHGESHDYRAVRHGRVISDAPFGGGMTNSEIDALQKN
jgi:hypothetical protein